MILQVRLLCQNAFLSILLETTRFMFTKSAIKNSIALAMNIYEVVSFHIKLRKVNLGNSAVRF